MEREEKKFLRSAAVDLGAGSGRVIVGGLRDGKIALKEANRFTTPSARNGSGYLHWEIDAIEENIRQGLKNAGPVSSVAVDSWGVDYVLLNEAQERIGDAVCYRDNRTEGWMERVQSRISAEEIYRRTGIQFQRFNTLYQLAATVEQESEWLQQARYLLMIPDYFHYKLSGVMANEYTNATTTQLLGVDGGWDKQLQEAIGLQRSLMQPPVQAGTVLGEMSNGFSGIKVIAPATHDTASAVAGAPLESENEAFLSSGTWSLMGIESRTPFVSAESMRSNFTNEGGVERRFRVLKNIMGMWLLQRVCTEFNVQNLGELVQAAALEPAWNSVIDPDDAALLNPENMTEAIRAACRAAGQPVPQTVASIARCIFDSLALSYRRVKEELEALRQRPLSRIRVVGGGCRNGLLNQLCANACQLPVCAGPVEASALGNLSVQWIAMGAVKDLDAARALIRSSFQPREYLPFAELPDSVWRHFQQLSVRG